MKQQDYYGNQFKWFVGIVKDATDVGRVRVRCFGVHPFEPSNVGDGPAYQAVSNGDLPWAAIVMPNNETALNHSLKEEDWVFGFFADGDACQQPVVVGKIFRADGQPSATTGSASTGTGTGAETGTTSGTDLLTTTPASKPKNENYYNIIPGDSNKQKVFNTFATFFIEEMKVEKPRALMIAAGICGSMQGESASFDPNAEYKGAVVNKHVGKTIDGEYAEVNWSRAYGICQWLGVRRLALYQLCKPGDLACQINFSISELTTRNYRHKMEGKYGGVLQKLLRSNSFGEASEIWTRYYEVPSTSQNDAKMLSEVKKRKLFAEKIYFDCKDKFEPAIIQFTKDSGGRER